MDLGELSGVKNASPLSARLSLFRRSLNHVLDATSRVLASASQLLGIVVIPELQKCSAWDELSLQDLQSGDCWS
jgi:hypothetical protein